MHIDAEIENIERQIESTIDQKMKCSELMKSVVRNPGKKAIIIGSVLAALNHLSGNFVLLSYTANIFEEAGSALQPNTSALIMSVAQFIGSCLASMLIERFGRKVSNRWVWIQPLPLLYCLHSSFYSFASYYTSYQQSVQHWDLASLVHLCCLNYCTMMFNH